MPEALAIPNDDIHERLLSRFGLDPDARAAPKAESLQTIVTVFAPGNEVGIVTRVVETLDA